MTNGESGSPRGRSSRHRLLYEQRRRATVADVLADALLPEPGNSFAEYLPVSDELATRVKFETGLNVAGHRHIVDEDHIRHVRELHGP